MAQSGATQLFPLSFLSIILSPADREAPAMGTSAALLPTQALPRGLGGDVDRVRCLLLPLTSCLPGHPAAQSLKTPGSFWPQF